MQQRSAYARVCRSLHPVALAAICRRVWLGLLVEGFSTTVIGVIHITPQSFTSAGQAPVFGKHNLVERGTQRRIYSWQ